MNSLVRCFGEQAGTPMSYIDHDWGQEPGAAVVQSHCALVDYGILAESDRSEGRIHWAGTESATEWIGFMEGALCRGTRGWLGHGE